MEKERSAVLDLAKGILIILVFIGHVPYGETPLKSLIFAFHMPAFFIISGILMRSSQSLSLPFSAYAAKRAKRLLIPVIFFELLAYGEVLLHWHGTFRIGEFLGKYTEPDLWNHADWFLLSLFAGECLFRLVRAGRKNLLIPSGLGAFIAACVIRFIPLSRCLMGYFFLVCGCVLYDRFMSVQPVQIISALALYILPLRFNPVRLDMHNAVYGSPVLMVMSAIGGTYLILVLCSLLKRCVPLEITGRNSLAVMGTHMPVLEIAHRVAESDLRVGIIALIMEIPAAILCSFLPFIRPKGHTK